MSLLPLVLGFDRPSRHMLPLHSHWPSRLLDQDFGLALTPDDLIASVAAPIVSEDYIRPWRQLQASLNLGSTIKLDKDKFQVTLDVNHFAPDGISVKTADGYIVVEGKHEEKKDGHGFISRQFIRRYAMPEGVLPENVESQLSSDGVLTITAPKKLPEAIQGERKVPITLTGPSAPKEIKVQNDVTEDK